MSRVADILANLYMRANADLTRSIIAVSEIQTKVEFVCRCISNRAAVRLIMACLLAKIDRPEIDPRKPYTEIGTPDSFSGRTYDEAFITRFINTHRLPCNPTTAFLTPALRNMDRVLTTDVILVGRPREIYTYTLQLLDAVYMEQITAEDLLTEIIRLLIVIRDEKDNRIETLLKDIQLSKDTLPLSSEAIVKLIEQHLNCKNTSRLPVLVVAAAYRAASSKLGEQIRPVLSHNAADEQTGSLGDIEVTLIDNEKVVTAYEMKDRRVTIDDINQALQKVTRSMYRVDNYIFITTDIISEEVRLYAANVYEQTGGVEMVILDCIGFLRHFLHLFHRIRMDFLNIYQNLVLSEPDSAVSQPLKEAFLALRQAAQAET